MDVPAVKLVRNVPVLRIGIILEVGVEQIELDAPYVGPPYPGEDRPSRQVHAHLEIVALFVRHGPQGQRVEVIDRSSFLLPAVRVEELFQIAFLVEQADAHHGLAGITGGFQEVPRQNSQAARVHRQAFHQPVFHGEVGNQFLPWSLLGLPHIGVQTLARLPVQGQKARVGRRPFQGLLRDTPEHQDRVAVADSSRARGPAAGTARGSWVPNCSTGCRPGPRGAGGPRAPPAGPGFLSAAGFQMPFIG